MVWIRSFLWSPQLKTEEKKGFEGRKAAGSGFKSGRVKVRGKQAKSKSRER